MLVEDPIYTDTKETQLPLFTDVSAIQRVGDSTGPPVRPSAHTLALKGYLYPPSDSVQALPSDLGTVISKSTELGLPLFIDAHLPYPPKLYLPSPFRHNAVSERLSSEMNNSSSIFSAAFPEIGMDSDEVSQEKWSKNSRISIEFDTLPRHSILSIPKQAISETYEFPRRKKRRKTWHNIYDDLDYRVKANKDSLEVLSQVEEAAYLGVGKTHYSPCNDMSTMEASEDPNSPLSPFQQRIRTLRPKLVIIPFTESSENSYLNYLSNSPYQ